MWIPARLTVPPGRTAANATGTSSPAGANTTARSHASGGGSAASPTHDAPSSRASSRWRFTAGQHHHLATPVLQHLEREVGRRAEARAARRARRVAPRRAAARGTRSRPRTAAARLRGRRAPAGSRTANASGTVTASAYPPSTVHPVNSARSQRFSSPRRQNSQTPHGAVQPRRRRRGRRAASSSQPSPSASTTPTAWCPGTTGRCGSVEVALDHVQVGAAAPARVDAQPHLAAARVRARGRSTRSSGRCSQERRPELRARSAAACGIATLDHATTKVASPLIAAPPDSTRVHSSSTSTLRSPPSS